MFSYFYKFILLLLSLTIVLNAHSFNALTPDKPNLFELSAVALSKSNSKTESTYDKAQKSLGMEPSTVIYPYQKGVYSEQSNKVEIPNSVLLLTADRIQRIKTKISQDSTAWDAMKSKISHYFDRIPYNAGEYAGAFSAAYYISGEEKYINRAIELLIHAYFSEPVIGWKYYKSRNLFRSHARWAVMGYSWIKHHISLQERERIEDILKLWSDYWLTHVDYQNGYAGLRLADTDDVTSITKNITLLGYALSNSTKYKEFGQELLVVGDYLLNTYVVGYYMSDIMAGGAWAEGSDYSPATQIHWMETFLINKDQRGIPFPNNYASEAMKSLLHQTLAGGSGVYKYGSEERAIDYDELGDDYRYAFALILMEILEAPEEKELIQNWFNKILSKKGFAKGSMVTHFDRLLYHDPTIRSLNPNDYLATLHIAEGIGLISTRNNWSEDATNLYFINRSIRVDHEHKDALSFDIAYKGRWITKERTGYAGISETSSAHNTILIENASPDGSSNPTRRAAGEPVTYNVYDNEYVTSISASATDVYNMSGYYATNYAKSVHRQVAFIKPSTVIVYDQVLTDKTAFKDLIAYKELEPVADTYLRWVKVIQHVQNEPVKITNRSNSYNVVNEGNKLTYQVLWPHDANVSVINEAELWKDAVEYEMPENQRKWHFEVKNNVPKENNEFVTSLNFGLNNDTDNYALDATILTQENGLIIEGEVIGVAFYVRSKPHIILFNKRPEYSSFPVKFNAPDGFDDAWVTRVGFTPE
ncbi:hypothetical protein [Thalassotalea sediminis]|uniref:hypothetical protein n=1 Tax=Thalassotalea sediminis TaxID=1759089 RepID=UPI0025747CE4|nr:hypothetical protein [Thalassotalea sediminis]